MTVDQILWISLFCVITIIVISMSYMDKKRKKLMEIFSKPILWIFLTIIMGFIISAFFVNDKNYHKAIGLGIVALLTAFFAELGMMITPFFLTVCFVMAFPNIF
jgi:cytochrome bd-type quinol oxidase subunit 2